MAGMSGMKKEKRERKIVGRTHPLENYAMAD